MANIRGSGEFGPAWHEAGRETKRQIIYDDFAAVANDIYARKLSSPAKFGIYGGSNGGLLMGVELNQHPDLWGADGGRVPLLDMLRYESIQAGASWVDEYGSASVPEEAAFLKTISPYQNLKPGGSTRSRSSGRRRRMTASVRNMRASSQREWTESGLPYLSYEDTAGGRWGDADIAQGARIKALEMTYFSQKLVGPGRVE